MNYSELLYYTFRYASNDTVKFINLVYDMYNNEKKR